MRARRPPAACRAPRGTSPTPACPCAIPCPPAAHRDSRLGAPAGDRRWPLRASPLPTLLRSRQGDHHLNRQPSLASILQLSQLHNLHLSPHLNQHLSPLRNHQRSLHHIPLLSLPTNLRLSHHPYQPGNPPLSLPRSRHLNLSCDLPPSHLVNPPSSPLRGL